jgi:hypothetical protein
MKAQLDLQQSPANDDQRTYEVPAIIYEGTITTRAGSPLGDGDNSLDPADIFGNNE